MHACDSRPKHRRRSQFGWSSSGRTLSWWCNEIHYRDLCTHCYKPCTIRTHLLQLDHFKSPSYTPAKPRQTVSWPTMLALCSWNVLTVMQMRVLSQFFAKGSASYKTTPETLANIHHSLGMRPRQDYSHCIMLNDCVSARWSLMCQYLALTSLRDSHPLPTRHSCESVMH